jgi:hypothetical protein
MCQSAKVFRCSFVAMLSFADLIYMPIYLIYMPISEL